MMDQNLDDVSFFDSQEPFKLDLIEKTSMQCDIQEKAELDAFISYRTKKKKINYLSATASVFDLLYGTGAHKRAQIFLDGYKIPKRVSTSEIKKINEGITRDERDLKFNIESDTGCHSDSKMSWNLEKGTARDEESDVNDNRNPSVFEDDFMDILIILAEDEDLPLPSP